MASKVRIIQKLGFVFIGVIAVILIMAMIGTIYDISQGYI
jgi:hypothetical protein